MLFFKKKQKQKQEEDNKEYSIQEILSITKSAKDENERQMKKAQSEYYKEIDAKIFQAAKRGENKVVAVSYDSFDYFYASHMDEFDYFVTQDFLEEVVRVYNAKGYKAEIVQPFNDEPYHKWVKISWE